MSFGRKLTVYLADGSPTGIRHVEIANWSGQAIACPRARLAELNDWQEAQRPGVYFLFEKQSGEMGDTAYIGESENLVTRLKQQAKGQDFWSEVVLFSSKDENLTKAHVKYLESRLTQIATEAERYRLANGNSPTQSTLPRADRDAMEEYIQNLRLILGTLGHRILEPLKQIAHPNVDLSQSKLLSSYLLSFTVRGLTGKGQITDEGFVLFAGSEISQKQKVSVPAKLRELLRNWVENGIVESKGNDYVLTKDYVMSSSSYAAVMVAGTARSGPESWKSEAGIQLKQLEADLLAE